MDRLARLIWSIVGALIAIFNLLCFIFLFRHRRSLFVKGMFHHLFAVCACDILVGIALAVETSPFVKQFKENIYFCVGSLMFFCLAQILSHTSVFGLILRRFIVIRNLQIMVPSYGWNKKYIIVMLVTGVTVLFTTCGAFIYLLPPKGEIVNLPCVVPIIYKDNARELYGVIFFWLITFLLGTNVLCFLCIKRLNQELKLRFSAEQNENKINPYEDICLTEYLTSTTDLSITCQSEVNLNLAKGKPVLENIQEAIPFKQTHTFDRVSSNDKPSSSVTSSPGEITRPRVGNTRISGVYKNHSFFAWKTRREQFDTTSSNVSFNEILYKSSTASLDASSADVEREFRDTCKKASHQTTTYRFLNAQEDDEQSLEQTENSQELSLHDSVSPLESEDTKENNGQHAYNTKRAFRVLRSSRSLIAKAEKKALVTLSMVVMLLNVSTAPTIVIVVIMALGGEISVVTRAIVGYSMCLNSFFNTMIYVLRIKRPRERVCGRKKVQEVEEVDATTQTL